MLNSDMLEIVGPALAAGLMIAFTHAPLGLEVLKRGIIFIDLAIAQIAGLGLVMAGTFLHEPSGWMMQAIALTGALLAGLCFRFTETVMPRQLEAVIGCSFVLSASLALLILADRPHGGEEIQHLLSGQILFVTWPDILKHAPVYGIILALWFIRPSIRNGIGFYLLFSMAITSSVQLVGIYLVFASLILPALAAIKARHKHLVAWSCSVTAILSGIILATWYDIPAGPFIVITYVISAMLYGVILTRRRSCL